MRLYLIINHGILFVFKRCQLLQRVRSCWRCGCGPALYDAC